MQVLQRRQALQRYSHILRVDHHHGSWQEVVLFSVSELWTKWESGNPLHAWLQLTNLILLSFSWKCQVEAECKQDPEGLALRLAGKGAVSAALEVAESAGLSAELRRELQGRQLVKLLTAEPLNGGGPAEASRFLSSLHDSDDALPVAMGAMQLLPNLRSKQLLVINCFHQPLFLGFDCAVSYALWVWKTIVNDSFLSFCKGSLLLEATRWESVRCWGFST